MAQHTISSPVHVDASVSKPVRVQVLQGEVTYVSRTDDGKKGKKSQKGQPKKIKAGDESVVFDKSVDLVPTETASIYLLD
mgnify:CR=1 FL=1